MSGSALKNKRHEAFAQAIAKGASQAEAYRKVYPGSEKWKEKALMTKASALARRGDISGRVVALQAAMAEKSAVDGARILLEAARLAVSDARRLFRENGTLKPIAEWDDDTAAAVSSVEVEHIGTGEQAVVTKTKVKLWDKNSALEKLFKNKGLFEADNKQGGGFRLVVVRD